MIRATWDTNMLASGAIAREGVIADLVDRWRSGEFAIVISDHIMTELTRVLQKPYFRARLSDGDRTAFLALVRQFAENSDVVDPIPDALPDRADNVILATALGAGTPYVVSGDRELQMLAAYQGCQILTARAFLELLDAETHD